MKTIAAIAAILLLVGAGAYFFVFKPSSIPQGTENVPAGGSEVATTTTGLHDREATTTIGTSAGGRAIMAYNFGEGDTELLFVGGIHGGYSWNTALVAYELINFLEKNPTAIPANLHITVIPVLNPDGLAKVVSKEGPFAKSDVSGSEATRVSGRFNAHNVDLNRNFDCEWQQSGTWQNTTVSGGATPFSEPESAAMQAYVEAHKPAAVVAWYSAAGGVFASSCRNGVSQETKDLTSLYAQASGYKAYESFDFYAITGDMVNWLAKDNIPAISVLLTTHEDTEWAKNRAGIEAMLAHYAE